MVTESDQPHRVAATQAKRSMKNLLLDRKFQLGWVVRVVVSTTLIVSVMGYFLYNTVADANDQMLAQQLEDMTITPEAAKAFIKETQKEKSYTLFLLIGGLFSLVAVLGVFTVFSTHKIAGPAYKLRRLFSSIDGDHLQLWAKLRKADELQETFVEFDEMLRRIREDRRRDLAILEEIRTELSSVDADERDRAVEKIEQFINRYKDSVKMD